MSPTLITFFIGFISISLEIILMSIISYARAGIAGTFGIVLSGVLLGIAFGAYRSYGLCLKNNDSEVLNKWIKTTLLKSATLSYFIFPVALLLMHLNFNVGLYFLLAYIAVSYYMGGLFPVLCHLKIQNNRQESGRYTSYLYFANICGATLGPLMTGFILMESILTAENFPFLASR